MDLGVGPHNPQTYLSLADPEVSIHALHYFIRRGQASNRAEAFLDHFNQRLEALFPTGLDLGDSLPKKKGSFPFQVGRP